MRRYLLLTRVILMSLFKTYPVSTGPFTQYLRSEGGSCLDHAVTFSLTIPSLVSCAFKCKYRTDCKNVIYKEETQSCIGCRDPCDRTSSSGRSSDGQCWKSKGDNYALDCHENAEKFNTTEAGVYWVKTTFGNVYDVFCLKTTSVEPPRWTVFLNRINGSVEFNRTLRDYEDGFGDVRGNHWRGWESIACFGESNNSYFSTKDTDYTEHGCSIRNGYGGWWWNDRCLSLNPTGRYMEPHIERSGHCLGYSDVDKVNMAFWRKN